MKALTSVEKPSTALYMPCLWVSYVNSHRQPGSNENINGLIRQYLPKGTDLSGDTQEQLDAIAYELNIRPRKRFNYRCSIEVITDVVLSEQKMLGSIQ